MAWVTVADAAEFPDGEAVPIRAGGTFLALVRNGDDLYALDDSCTHEECPLSDGIVTGTELTCFCHGSVFDLRTGEALTGPALESVRTYPVRVQDGEVQVEL